MKKVLAFLAVILLFTNIYSQNKPAFWDDIQQFKALNQENPPTKGAILLLGSSSFTMWTDVHNYFPEKTFINRAFGGSSLLDLNLYSNELLAPYQPKQIVIYCGENDIANNAKAKTVLNRFKNFYKEIRKYHPNIPVEYVSMKYSPSRENMWPQMKQANSLIQKYISKQKNIRYIDITKVMNDEKGNVRTDIFLEDMLHMKPEGYQLWTGVLAPYLK